jgi:chromosomal replication initiation ATPase DnaA
VDSFLQQRSGAVSRDLAAWLARELKPVTLQEMSPAFGLTHPDSVRGLTRRADRAVLGSRALRNEIEAIRHRLPKTGNRP